MNKRNLRFSGSGAVKASLLSLFAPVFMASCGTDAPASNQTTSNSTCQGTGCGTTGNGGSAGTTNVGGSGGHGGSTTSVGGSGGTSTGTGGSGGSAGATHSGGAGGFGGNTTTNTGGSAGATNVGGSGGSGGTTTGTGGQGGATTTTTDAGVGGSGGASTTTTDAGILNSFSCSGWTRDPLFDAFKIPDQNGNPADVELVGGIWGTSGDDFYISAATYAKGVVAHWYGGAFHLETLPNATEVHGIWGSGSGDVWATARDGSKGLLFHRDAQGVWTRDLNAPTPEWLMDVWGLDASHVYLVGEDPGIGRVWKRSGANWTNTNLPNPMQAGDIGFAATRVWGIDLSHIFVTGYRLNSNGVSTGGVLWMYDGINWTIIQTPQEAKELATVHGTSVQDFFVSGIGTDAYVYHVTNNMSTWNAFTRSNFVGYGPLLSLKSGTFLAAGYQPPAGAGSLRITTGDQVSPEVTVDVDKLAYNPVAFWREPGTMKVHLIVISGHYVGTCQ